MAQDYDLDPVEALSTGAIGQPGQRVFYLQARAAGDIVTLQIEKVQLEALLVRLGELLESLDPSADAPPAADLLPLEPVWRVGQLGLAFDTHRKLVLFIAQELTEEEDGEGATARLWAPVPTAVAFSQQAVSVIQAGRQPCPLCGLPLDPRGHVCPKKNGSRPVVS
jgi:uncharacterized repeat protein (TIGR03847 family)